MEHQKTPGERDRGASREDGKQSHPLSPSPANTSEGASGKNRVSLSSLHAPILFSGFPV